MNTTRRKFLRGTGVALGLPWLESVSVFGAETPKQNVAPRRLGVCFTGNGVNPHHWGAKMGSNGIEFANSLRPLEPIKNQVAVFTGLWNPTTIEGEGGHYPKMNVLCGLRVKKTTTDVEVGTTMDQIVAAHAGRNTPVPSIVLGTERPSYATDSGFTSIYSAYISWSTPTTPAPKEIFPQQAFDQLFDDGSKRKRDKSILDLVLGDAKGLRARLSQRDSQKLDEYLTSVREIELRVEQAEKISQAETGGQGWQPSVKTPTLGRPEAGIPASSEDHLRIMFDILLLAYQMDRTRVATFMLNNDLSNMRFPSLDGVSSGIHELSHHANDETRLAHYQKVNEFQVKLWSEFLQKMAATNEGERSLLDNSMILLTSSLMDGNAHDSKQLPVVLAGGGGGTIKGGQAYDLSADPNRKLCRLHLALMDRMGVRVDRFGDAENALAI
ncbi:MAG: DUF1552 domain-containing protein [Verrucomicrobiales bacterium]|jgi:hypothetical protein|nr:DUF1552 domain-containing protein [Verrucomicrobiales bacterium]